MASGWPAPRRLRSPTIEALLAARIDRLRPELKELLQCAAVIGHDIKEALLEAVTGLEHSELRRAVWDLQVAEFLYEKALFPETEYIFKHGMTREVAYASLLRERRTALHARAAHALETLAAGRLDEHVERLADHAERGALWDKALIPAALRAQGVLALRERRCCALIRAGADRPEQITGNPGQPTTERRSSPGASQRSAAARRDGPHPALSG